MTDLITEASVGCVCFSGLKVEIPAEFHLLVPLSFGSLPHSVHKGEQCRSETRRMENYQSEIREASRHSEGAHLFLHSLMVPFLPAVVCYILHMMLVYAKYETA